MTFLKRPTLARLVVLWFLPAMLAAAPAKTHVTIAGDDFLLNGQLTYAGRAWQGHRIEGLLLDRKSTRLNSSHG